MKKYKQLFLLLISLILIMGVCGCMSNNNSNKAETIKDKALEYLNANYDDTFTALGYSDGDWAYDYSTVSFTSKKYSKSVEVRVYEENGIYSCKDDYFKLTMNDDAEKYFKDIAMKHGYTSIGVKVRFVSLGTSDTYAYKPFSEYVTNGKCNIEVYYICNEKFSESDIKEILTEICNIKIMGNFRFVTTIDIDLLSQYSISEIVNEKADTITEKQSYSINSSYEIIE